MKSETKPIDFNEHVNLQVRTLQLNCVWFYIPYPTTSVWFWWHILIRIVYGIFVFTMPPLLQLAYLVKLLESDNLDIESIASSINMILTELDASLRLVNMFCQRNLVTKLIHELINGEFHRTTNREVLQNAIKTSRKVFWYFLLCTGLDVFTQIVVVPGLGRFRIRTLPVKMDLVFVNANETPYFYYAYFYQVLYKPPLVIIFIALHTLPWSLLSFSIAQLDILIDNFKNMETLVKLTKIKRKCGKDDAYRDVFNGFVHHHRAIIRFVKTSEAAFSGQFALTLLLCSGVICTTGVQFLSIESPSKDIFGVIWIMAYLAIFVFILFTDCYFGNSIYVKSIELATVAYGSPWLDMPQDLRKNLVLVIARAQKPMVITAYSLFNVSLPTFTTVMDWTYKAFAIMNGMK